MRLLVPPLVMAGLILPLKFQIGDNENRMLLSFKHEKDIVNIFLEEVRGFSLLAAFS